MLKLDNPKTTKANQMDKKAKALLYDQGNFWFISWHKSSKH